MGAHAFLAPSSAHIWGSPRGCRAYPRLSAPYAGAETDESRAGDACHEVGAEAIAQRMRAMAPQYGPGTVASNGVVIDDELAEAVEVYEAAAWAHMVRLGCFSGDAVWLERRLDPALRVHPDNWGTPDVLIYSARAAELVVLDAKFGHGLVEAPENWQLINYAALAIEALGLDGIDEQRITFRLVVVQPRGYHRDGPVREWAISGADLRNYVNQLATAAAEAVHPDAKARTGPHCRHCEARHVCPAARLVGLDCIEVAHAAAPQPLPVDAIALELRWLERAAKALEYRITALREHAEALARAGTPPPGLALSPKVGRLAWLQDKRDVFALGEMLGVDLRRDEPVTPTQAKKLAGKDAAELIDSYAHRPPAGFELVPCEATLAARVFKK